MSKETESAAAAENTPAPEAKAENTLKLHVPIDINGKKVSALRYNFDDIDGRDMDAIARHKLKALNNQPDATPAVMNDAELRYTFYMAVTKAMSEVDVLDLQRLKLRDQMAGKKLAQNFIISSGDGGQESSDEL